jgi:hypothetical protein
VLVNCRAKKACTIEELRVERFQLEMQLVVTRAAAARAVMRTTLEVEEKSVEDRATAAQSVADASMEERAALEVKLVQAEATAVGLRTAAATTAEVAQTATTAATATEAAAQEKTVLDKRVAELE